MKKEFFCAEIKCTAKKCQEHMQKLNNLGILERSSLNRSSMFSELIITSQSEVYL